MSYNEFLTKDQRLVILRILSEMISYKANSSVLHNLLSQYGHEISRDKLKTELRWLEEQGLLSLESISESVLLATLTTRGDDVAKGRAIVDGINRPGA